MSKQSNIFYQCRCFYRDNFYLSQINQHVSYENRQQFVADYKPLLEHCKCASEEDVDSLVQQLEVERERRYAQGQMSLERQQFVKLNYTPLHPQVYKLKESYLSPEFLRLVSYCQGTDATMDGCLDLLKKESGERVYSFPVFNAEFCQEFIEELTHFEKSDMPKGRPNTMNNYGIRLEELGFDDELIDPLREKYLTPIARILYPDWGGDALDSHKVFIVTYKIGDDTDLSSHYDNTEITLNVCLGKQFEEGSLYFGNMRTNNEPDESFTEFVHKINHGVIHRGQHLHGAMPITEGERYNLIIWMRSSSIRNLECPMCSDKPDLVQVTGAGDGFTKDAVNVCNIE